MRFSTASALPAGQGWFAYAYSRQAEQLPKETRGEETIVRIALA